ncbi:MAG TPA: phospholipase D family protein [Polyangiaceae bacterium]
MSATRIRRVTRGRSSTDDRRQVELQLIKDAAHYREVVEHGILTAQTSIWIATANVKDAHIEAPLGTRARARGRYTSLIDWLIDKAKAGVEVRILHAGVPSRALQNKQRWSDARNLHRCCPRVHLKMVAVDGRFLYLGSANLTGAGLGAKSDRKRNFEVGMVTDDALLLDELQGTFDAIWSGKHCAACGMRSQCPKPLDGIVDQRDLRRERRAEAERTLRARKLTTTR